MEKGVPAREGKKMLTNVTLVWCIYWPFLLEGDLNNVALKTCARGKRKIKTCPSTRCDP